MKSTILLRLGVLSVAAVLAGCGGGGGDETPIVVPTAEGAYGGTMTGGVDTAFLSLILENGEYWSAYGTGTVSGVFVPRSLVQGPGTSDNGSYTSSNLKDYGTEPAQSGSLAATYDATAMTIKGTVTFSGKSQSFSGGPIPGSTYNYNTPASLSTITGAWTLTNSGGDIPITVASNGNWSTSMEGCVTNGTMAPRASGKNVFDVAYTDGPAPCNPPNLKGSGIAVAYPLTDGRTQLLVGLIQANGTGIGLIGVR